MILDLKNKPIQPQWNLVAFLNAEDCMEVVGIVEFVTADVTFEIWQERDLEEPLPAEVVVLECGGVEDITQVGRWIDGDEDIPLQILDELHYVLGCEDDLAALPEWLAGGLGLTAA